MLGETPPVGFGGAGFCQYTITLKDLAIEIDILPGGQVSSGRAQALNVETIVVSTTPNCPASTPVIPPNTATYTFQSAAPIPDGMQLTFTGGPTNNPRATLVVDLTAVTTGFQARMTFHRIDQQAPLDWRVVAMLSMSVP